MPSTEVGTRNIEVNKIDSCPCGADILIGRLDIKQVMMIVKEGLGDTTCRGIIFFWAPKSLQMVTAAMKLKDAYYWKKTYDQPR